MCQLRRCQSIGRILPAGTARPSQEGETSTLNPSVVPGTRSPRYHLNNPSPHASRVGHLLLLHYMVRLLASSCAQEKSDLIRLQTYLGHPSPETLAKHLAIAKASPHVVQAAKEFVCDACVESTQPRHQRPAKLHEVSEFNEEVGLDGFYWRGQGGFQVHVVHLIDEGSCFNLGRRSTSRHHLDTLQVIQDAWNSWAGPPCHLYLDPAGELRAAKLEETLQPWGTTCFVTSEAWQRGRVERHGRIIKQMLTRMDNQQPTATVEEFDTILLLCFQAKNAMVRRFGYPPEQRQKVNSSDNAWKGVCKHNRHLPKLTTMRPFADPFSGDQIPLETSTAPDNRFSTG